MNDVALAIFWNPVLVRMCTEVGVGAKMRIRRGGKICEASGDAVDIDVTRRGIRENMTQLLGETEMPMGTGVWLEADGVHVILSSLHTQCINPSVSTEFGLDLSDMKAIVVKSSNHFYNAFAPIAREIIHMSTPGTMPSDVMLVTYTKRDGDYWPNVENPFAN